MKKSEIIAMPPAPVACNVQMPLRPNQKKVILKFAVRHGRGYKRRNENVKLLQGTRWILETALTMIGAISEQATHLANYRDAEGWEHTQFYDCMAARSLKKWNELFIK